MLQPMPIVKGTLDLLVLRALSWKPMHGFEIRSWLEANAPGALSFEDSAIYQSLYRMEGRDLVAAKWGTTDEGRRARYYRLTLAGRSYLRSEIEGWERYARVVTSLLRLEPKAR